MSTQQRQFDRLVHITDLHIQRDAVHNQRVQDRLEMLQDAYPDCFLVVGGDITDGAHVDEYEKARELLVAWQDRCLLVPGNHDYGELGLEYSRAAEDRFHGFRMSLGSAEPGEIVPLHDRHLVVGLDSCCKTTVPIDLAQGRLGERQLTRLGQVQAAAVQGGCQIHVALHHDPANQFWAEKLQDADELLRRTWGKVATVLVGHTHSRFDWTCPRGIPTRLHRERNFGTAQDLPLAELCFVVELG